MWDVPTRSQLRVITRPFRSRDPSRIPLNAAFSRDGRLVATVSQRGLELRSAATGELQWRRRGDYATVAFDPRTRQLLTTDYAFNPASSPAPAARVWTVSGGKEIGSLADRRTAIFAQAAFVGDGRRVLSSGRLWKPARDRVTTLDKLPASKLPRFSPEVVAPDGGRVATAANGPTSIWDARDGRRLARLPAPSSPITALSFGADGRTVLTGHGDGSIELWDPRVEALESPAKLMSSVAVSPDSRRIAGISEHRALQIWDASTGRRVSRPPVRLEDCVPIGALCDASMRYQADGQHLHLVLLHASLVVSLASPAKIRNRFTSRLGANAAISADGRSVAISADRGSAQREGDVVVRNVNTMRRVSHIRGTGVDAMALSADGRRLVTNSDTDAILWNVRTGRRVSTVTAELSGGIASGISGGPSADRVAISRDGAHAVAALGDGTVRSFRADRRSKPKLLTRDTRNDARVRFSPDDRYIVISGPHKSTEIYVAANGRRVATFAEAGASAMTSENRHIVIVGPGDGGSIYTCDACSSFPQLLRTAEKRTRRTLTSAERARFLGD